MMDKPICDPHCTCLHCQVKRGEKRIEELTAEKEIMRRQRDEARSMLLGIRHNLTTLERVWAHDADLYTTAAKEGE